MRKKTKQNDKQTIANEKKKKKKNKEKEENGTAEAWTRTASVQGNPLRHWATKENTVTPVKNIIFKAYFFGETAPVKTSWECWWSRKSRNLKLVSLSKY